MKCLTLCLLIGWLGQTVSGLQGSSHVGLNQEGNVTCLKTGEDYLLHFEVYLHGDNPDIIYTVNKTNPDDITAETFSSQTGGIEGNGTDSWPYTFNITATLTNAGFNFTADDDTLKKAYSIGSDVIGVDVMVKSRYRAPLFHHANFAEDVLYQVVCDFSKYSDLTLTSDKLSVQGNVGENVLVAQEQATFNVISAGQTTSAVQLGDKIQLKIALVQPSFAVSLFAHSCYICDGPLCDGALMIEFLTPSGCRSNLFISGFQPNGTGEILTAEFKAFILTENPALFFQCTVGFCYEPDMRQCTDYCAFNSRKRRSVVGKTEEVLKVGLSVILPVVDGGTVVMDVKDPLAAGVAEANKRKAEAEKQAQVENDTLVGSVSSVACVAIAVVAIGGGIYLKKKLSTPTNLLDQAA